MRSLATDKNQRVLVIDDLRSIHDDFRKILVPALTPTLTMDTTEQVLLGRAAGTVQFAPFEVDSAYQGQEGWLLVQQALAAGRPYALAFVDVRMPPGWDGVETARRLRELDPQLQIVFCTAYADYAWGEIFNQLGQRDGWLILKKPFDPVEALQLAHALTEKWWLHQQARHKMEELERLVGVRTNELRQTTKALASKITALEQAEQTLRESDEKFRQLADNLADGFWIGAPDLRELHYLSPALAQIWGRPLASLYAEPQPWPDFVLPEDRPRVQAGFAALAAAAESLDLEHRIVRPGGEIRWVRVRSFPVRDAAGQLIRHAGIVSDITDPKKLEAQLIQSQKLETVGRLAGGVAHEFNSLLTAIIGQSELLRADLPPGDPLRQNATEILTAAERAATLTRQLLAYGRKQFLRPERLDLNQVLLGLAGVLRHLMSGAAVSVDFAPAPNLQPVRADAGQIEQVIMNLAINARDAMPTGGRLALETANVSLAATSRDRDPEMKPGDYVLLTIRDTGLGMSAEVKARAFEPFFTTKDVGQGTGLGLSTCYGIIKQSGGHISVQSEPGGGAVFKIFLPQAHPPSGPPPRQ